MGCLLVSSDAVSGIDLVHAPLAKGRIKVINFAACNLGSTNSSLCILALTCNLNARISRQKALPCLKRTMPRYAYIGGAEAASIECPAEVL